VGRAELGVISRRREPLIAESKTSVVAKSHSGFDLSLLGDFPGLIRTVEVGYLPVDR
jgi:hypothetical protein